MNILISGATGFLGNHLITHLLHSTSLPINKIVALHRRRHFFDSISDTRLISMDSFDLTNIDKEQLKQVLETYQINVFIHLAFVMDFYPKNPMHMRKVNIEGTDCILETWSHYILKQPNKNEFVFLFASSQEAMGPCTKIEEPITEFFVCRTQIDHRNDGCSICQTISICALQYANSGSDWSSK